MAKKTTYKGSVTLYTNRKDKTTGQPVKGLVSECLRHPQTGTPGIFIPIDVNPSIYVNERDGVRSISLDIELVETPNSKWGSHMIKLAVGKENRQKLGTLTNEQWNDLTPPVGNIKTIPGDQNGQQGGYQGPNMPESIAGGNAAPPQFDGSW